MSLAVLRAAAWACTVASVAVLFLVSSALLDGFGYHYDIEGGSIIEKIHPATILALVALGLRVASSPDPGRLIAHVLFGDHALVLAIALIVILEIYVVAVLNVPATPPIDTYVLPLLYCLLLKDLNRRGARVLAILIVGFFAANALAALYERMAGVRLFFVIPDDITGHPEDPNGRFDWKGHLTDDWRSTALLGHPLENAMLTGCFMLILQARGTLARAGRIVAGPAVVAGLLLLEFCAMITFGGRVALILVVLTSLLWWIGRAGRGDRHGVPLAAGRSMAILLGLSATLVALLLAHYFGAFDRLIERFAEDDGSAQTRLTMWRMFEPLSWEAIVFGPDGAAVSTQQRLLGLELGIESFWAGLPLTYGLIMSGVILANWGLLATYLVRTTRREAAIVILFYFLVGSASAGLASKTTSVGILCVLVLVLLRRDRPATTSRPRRRPAESYGGDRVFAGPRQVAAAGRAPAVAATTAAPQFPARSIHS